MQITIYNSMREALEKKLNGIKRKADKYGCQFSFGFGDPYAKTIKVYSEQYNYADHVYERDFVGDHIVEAVDLTIDGEDLIRKDGWTAVAQLEHFDNGNLINRFDHGDYVTPGAWRTLPPRCEHCGITRQRNVTYMVKDPEGTYRQVGSSCLKDYTGIDPKTATVFATLFDEITLCECDGSHYDPDRERGNRIYSTEYVIAHAVDSIHANGYRNVNSPDSTKDQVYKAISNNAHPSEEGWAKAEQIVKWLTETDFDRIPMYSLENDCAVLAKNEYCKLSHIGRLAYIPVSYDKFIAKQEEQKRREEENAKAAQTSDHIGTVGKRMVFDIKTFDHVTSWETQYGTTHLYKFTTTDGNVLVWFASSTFGYWHTVGDREVWNLYKPEEVKAIKATVKDHTERDGIKQTVITRCNIA